MGNRVFQVEDQSALTFYLEQLKRYPLLEGQQSVEVAREFREARENLAELLCTVPTARLDRASGHDPKRHWTLHELDEAYCKLVRLAKKMPQGHLGSLAEEATGYKQRLDSARERLITGNLRLVIRVAKKYAGQGCSLMDLVQDGNIGLMKAVERFEDRRGFRFSTYAYWWLSQAMQRSIVEKARTIRLPTHIAIKKRMLALVSRELTQRLARIPSHKESADELRIPVVEVDRLLTAVTELETLTFPAEGPDCIVPGGLPDPNSPSPLEKLVREESRGRVNSLLRVLDDREKRIICLRFGLDGTTPKTLRQVGAELGLSAERVRQIQRHAMRTLQAKRNRPIGPSRRPAYTGAIIVPDEAKQANFAAGRTAKGRPHPMGGAGQSGDVAKAN